MRSFSFQPTKHQKHVQFLCSFPKTETKTTQATPNRNSMILCSFCAVSQTKNRNVQLLCSFSRQKQKRHKQYQTETTWRCAVLCSSSQEPLDTSCPAVRSVHSKKRMYSVSRCVLYIRAVLRFCFWV